MIGSAMFGATFNLKDDSLLINGLASNNCFSHRNVFQKIKTCSKNYGSPTRVTRLKVEPNLAEPISIKNSGSRLNSSCNQPIKQIKKRC